MIDPSKMMFVEIPKSSHPFAGSGRTINGLPADAWLVEKSIRCVESLCAAISASRTIEDEALRENQLQHLQEALRQALNLACWSAGDESLGDSGSLKLLFDQPDTNIRVWRKAMETP